MIVQDIRKSRGYGFMLGPMPAAPPADDGLEPDYNSNLQPPPSTSGGSPTAGSTSPGGPAVASATDWSSILGGLIGGVTRGLVSGGGLTTTTIRQAPPVVAVQPKAPFPVLPVVLGGVAVLGIGAVLLLRKPRTA